MSEKFLVKVWNRGRKEYTAVMDDVEYRIPANGYIEVSRTEANRLKHTYTNPIRRDGIGNELSPQPLELEYPKDEFGKEIRYRTKESSNKSMLDGKEYPSADALKAHILANSDKLDNKDAALKSMKR